MAPLHETQRCFEFVERLHQGLLYGLRQDVVRSAQGSNEDEGEQIVAEESEPGGIGRARFHSPEQNAASAEYHSAAEPFGGHEQVQAEPCESALHQSVKMPSSA